MLQIRRPLSLHRLVRSLTLLSCVGVMLFTSATSQAIRKIDLYNINTNTSFYDPTAVPCDSSTTSVPTRLPNNIPPAWRNVLTSAASAKNTSALLLAALVMDEQGNDWRDFDYPWSTSNVGAQGPFQFLPGTWDGHKQDGNGDGKMDVQNVWDAAYAAADMISKLGVQPNTPLGTLDKPLARGTLLYAAYAYNQGPGAAERLPDTATLDQLAPEGRNYVENTYAVISSGFTKKGGSYSNDPISTMKNPGDAGTSNSQGGTPTANGGQDCCGASGQKVVVLDPGHSGTDNKVTDSATGLIDYDYPNDPEIYDVFDVALLVRAQLLKDGYRVIMTKGGENPTAQDALDVVTLRQRADIANNQHADIAVSIHDQSGSGGLPFSSANNIVYDQGTPAAASSQDLNAHLYRQTPSGTRIPFTNAATATKTQTYAKNFKQERASAEGHAITLKEDAGSDIGDRGLAPGNIWMVQLFSNVPWVYNEAGGVSSSGTIQHKSGLSDEDKQKYATGIINGIEKSVPANTGTSTGTSCGSTNTIVNTALGLAWPTPYGVDSTADRTNGRTGPLTPKPSYTAALQQYNPDGMSLYDGADCGVFVSTVMRTSGADKNYPSSGTSVQEHYVRTSGKYDVYDSINNTSEVHPGDILIVNAGTGEGSQGHTMIWLGPQPHGYNEASASFQTRMPNLNTLTSLTESRGHYLVARLKSAP